MPARILVVDNESSLPKTFSQIFEQQIRSLQYEFIYINDRREALEKIQIEPPDLILLELKIPSLDGFELIEQLHQHQIKVKTIIISALGTFEHTRRAMQLGASDFLVKPLQPKDVKESIKRVLETFQSIERVKEKKIHYNTVFKLVRELNSDLNYKLTIENIQRFELDQFEELRKNLPILEARVREEQKRREFLNQRDIEREKQGKLPLLPLIEGAIDPRSYNSKSKSGELKRYRYFYVRLPNPSGGYISQPIDREHLYDPDVRKIIEKKLGKPIDPEFL